MSAAPYPDPQTRLAATLARLCEREDLDRSETAAALAQALTRTPDLPRDPAPLLRSFATAS